MQRLADILSVIAKGSGALLIAVALLAAGGRIFPPTVPADDIAVVSLLALGEGLLYLLPLRLVLAGRRRVMLYLAATLFVPFLVALAAVQYSLSATVPSGRMAANLTSAAAVFIMALCPPAAVLAALVARGRPG